MFRRMIPTLILLAALPAFAQEPKPPQLTPEEQKLAAEATKLNEEGMQLYERGQPAAAVEKMRQSLEIYQKLYSAAKYPDGHADLAASLNDLGFALLAVGSVEKTLEYYEQSFAMRQKLYPAAKYPDGHGELAQSLNNLGAVRAAMGELEKAFDSYERALVMNRRLYPLAKYPDGHSELATNLNNLGTVLIQMGALEKASAYFEQALAMTRAAYPATRFPSGHLELAQSLSNFGSVLHYMGSYEKALAQFEQGLAMRQKLFPAADYPEGHPEVAESLNNLGHALVSRGAFQQAGKIFEQSLAMHQSLYPQTEYPKGHPNLARSWSSLGLVHQRMGSHEKALEFHQKSLAINRLLYPTSRYSEGHPDLAKSLNNMGSVFSGMRKFEKASEFLEQALAMTRALYPVEKYPDGHPNLAAALTNHGEVLFRMESVDKALDFLAQALDMTQRLVNREIRTASEARALAQIAALRKGLSATYFSAAVSVSSTTDISYRAVWDEKGTVQRLLSRRHLAAAIRRHESADIRRQYEQLGQIRRDIARLGSQASNNPVARDKRLAALSDDQDRLERALATQIPALDRDRDLVNLQPKDLITKLPPQTVFVDFVRYAHSSSTKESGNRYLAFILAAGQPIRRIELGDADPIDQAVTAWRGAISSRQSSPSSLRLKELVWSKLVHHIPAGTKTLYVAPDGDLTRLPWAALPIGDDKVLLEDYAVAIVPHGPFLLESLKYPRTYLEATSILALGDVAYQSKAWPDLPGTAVELKSLPVKSPVMLTGSNATQARLLAELPKARYAHLATHGYFDVETLTAEKKRADQAAKSRIFGDESPYVMVKNPLGFVGLVLANGEVLNGLSLVDLPLEHLNLVTLSACETGLGELTGSEGVQGLQRAFHLAGCPNVIASLWKVGDVSTAVLMEEFYTRLWSKEKPLPPIEALREAQLTILRNPDKVLKRHEAMVAELKKQGLSEKEIASRGFKTDLAVLPEGGKVADLKRSPTQWWAAFVLSGVGK